LRRSRKLYRQISAEVFSKSKTSSLLGLLARNYLEWNPGQIAQNSLSAAVTADSLPLRIKGECYDAVQPAGVASDPEKAPGEHATIEKRSKLLLDETRYIPLVILL